MKNQSFKARQVDVTAKFSTSLNSSINRDEDLENNITRQHTRIQGQYSAQNVENKHQQLREFFNCFYLRIPKCLEIRVCSVSYCIVNTSDCISTIQNLIQLFLIVKLSLFQL